MGSNLRTLGIFCLIAWKPPVERKFRAISDMKSEIKKAGLKLSMMSGSGPTVYGVASGKEEALEAKSRLLLGNGWQAFVARTLW